MATPEPSGPKTVRPEHASAGKAEENDYKNNFIKMRGPLKGNEKLP